MLVTAPYVKAANDWMVRNTCNLRSSSYFGLSGSLNGWTVHTGQSSPSGCHVVGRAIATYSPQNYAAWYLPVNDSNRARNHHVLAYIPCDSHRGTVVYYRSYPRGTSQGYFQRQINQGYWCNRYAEIDSRYFETRDPNAGYMMISDHSCPQCGGRPFAIESAYFNGLP